MPHGYYTKTKEFKRLERLVKELCCRIATLEEEVALLEVQVQEESHV